MVLALFLWPFGVCFADTSVDLAPTESEKLFLDRLMTAESAGRQYAKNPLSGAYGPFQFVSATFLDVVKRNFPAVVAGKTDDEVLKLRADWEVSRNAALVYTRENARYFADHNTPVTAANLRLAFFVGPGAALKVLTAKPEEILTNVLSAAAIAANPFLGGMTAGGLIQRAAREAEGAGRAFIKAPANSAAANAKKLNIDVRCNLKLASCRHWLALAEKRMGFRRVVLAPVSTAR